FNDVHGKICMVRISFDGYGCCRLGRDAVPLDEADSALFREHIKTATLDQNVMGRLIKKTISLNRSIIWEEALQKYELV
ncbi:MAG: hypothetical protein ACRCWR_03545, partial [Saezia sp.]